MRIAYNHEGLFFHPREWISLAKPAQVFNLCYETWRDQLLQVFPFSEDDYARVHDRAWVQSVLAGESPNGFSDFRPEVLKQVSFAHGAMYAAAKAALTYGCAFAPVSGFHHAGYDYNGGFCTFNGLLTTIARLRVRQQLKGLAMILDFDGHWGDGTADILSHQESVKMLSPVLHLSRNHPFKDPIISTEFALGAIEAYRPALILLQAGADSLKDDPFGAGYYSLPQWISRDEQIFKLCKKLDIPICWNLAGGYDEEGKTLYAHRETFFSASEVFDGVSKSRALRPGEIAHRESLGLFLPEQPLPHQSSAES